MITYKVLEIKRPSGRIVATIESFDNIPRLQFAESDSLKDSLNKYLTNGIYVTIPVGSEYIFINSKPSDHDFFEKIATYLQLMFDYICLYKVTPIFFPMQHNARLISRQVRFLPVAESHFSWPNFNITLEPDTMSMHCSSTKVTSPFNWIPE